MCTPNQNVLVLENTRRITVQLSQGITSERLTTALNERRVKLVEGYLRDSQTDEVLAGLVSSTNTADYSAAEDQTPLPPLDHMDIYDLGFNQV